MEISQMAGRHVEVPRVQASPLKKQRTLPSIVIMGTLLTAVLTVLLTALLLGVGTLKAGAQDIDSPVPNPTVSSSDGALLAQMVNDYRVANGLNPLVVDSSFAARTEAHAQRLTSLNPTGATPPGYAFWCPSTSPSSFFHDSVDAQWASAPAGAVAYGENIAFRCSQSFSTHASDIMTSWKNSPGHNTNMLNPDWTHIGSVSVRWNNVSIAVHRFATVPGTAVPAATQAVQAAPTATPIPAPTATPVPVVTATPTPEPTPVSDATPTVAPTATPESDSTDDQTAIENDETASGDSAGSAATASASNSAAAGPQQLAFTGSNLNLALLGLACIVAGGGLLMLPSVRGINKED